MRRLRADVSHRIRPRGPSLLGAGWLRLLLAGAAAVVLGLVVGPVVVARLGADASRLARLFSPPGPSPADGVQPRPAHPGAAPVPESRGAPAAAVPTPATPAPRPAVARPAVSQGPVSLPAGGSGPFRVQVGTFRDPGNADRLVERLSREGFPAAAVVVEQSQVRYRVVLGAAVGQDAGRHLARAAELGFRPEAGPGDAALTGPLPLADAALASQRLREGGVPVRLTQEVVPVALKVVRVGPYATAEEAGRALAALEARGQGGLVVREP